MKVILFDNSILQEEKLPHKITGNYTFKLQNLEEIINIEENSGNWCIYSNDKYQIFKQNQPVGNIILRPLEFYNIRFNGLEKEYILYIPPIYDDTFSKYCINNNTTIKIGKNQQNNICYNLPIIDNLELIINYNNGLWEISNLSNSKVFYNNKIINNTTIIKSGDGIFIYGLYIYFIDNIITFNNPQNMVTSDHSILKNIENKQNNIIKDFKQKYFFKSPRLQTGVDLEDVTIDNPPEFNDKDQDSAIMTMAPMAIMGIAYIITGASSLINIIVNGQSLMSALPSLAITFSMLFGMLIWPIVSNKYKKRKQKKNIKNGTKKYRDYLNEKEQIIIKNINNKRQVRMENYFSESECLNIIKNQKKELWNRDISSSDFLTIRVGIGTEELGFEIKYPNQSFTLKENNLFDDIKTLQQKYQNIDKIPVLLSLYENNSIGIINESKKGHDFLNYMILQLMTYYSYDDIKFVTFTSKKNENLWEYMKILPHSWNEEKSFRYFASKQAEMKQISTELMEVYNYRNNLGDREKNKIPQPYYFIIIDNIQDARNLDIVKSILSSEKNNGFSIIILEDTILNLPSECSKFINIGTKTSGIFERQLVSDKQVQFNNEMIESINIYEVSKILASIKLSPSTSKKVNLPKKLSFLEMYNVGKIEQLNSLSKWENNNPIISLQAPIGIASTGELLSLDLHEKFHGPHGLIAGTTGSGKSEFIITYILSLAVNYHPYEVSFILIDYKGGGLAGAFENSTTKEKIPHLVGTITNLDTASINRTLVAIESELKRRQRIFNEARKYSNEGTIDIYKYQRMYREKIVTEPMPSLFIICDEFAELKTQQPEFMEQLISASRIGRSLGIHLILATQKPSGVVNDQIWSNSRFHICLKVQTESDSMEIIKKKDAAFIKETGRLYLQVGNDEMYLYGQSAYTGDKYTPTIGNYIKEDSYVSFIDNIGYEYKKMNLEEKKIITADSKSELISVVNYLIDLGKKENIPSRQLWLDPIPKDIFINELLKKYKYQKQNNILNLVLGEYDDPANQRQDLLTLPLTEEGNTLIFGIAGSGKEKLLSTMLYSGITNYHTNEVNFYILDFGAEILRVFKDAPQVGDYITSVDGEKVNNLFRLLYDELEKRKKLFSDFGGSYISYITKSNNPLPNIVVIINNYEVFNEVYGNYEDILMKLTRDGLKYGIIFVLTTNSLRSIRYNMRQNFAQNIGMRVNDNSDYFDVFGRTSIVPSDYKGRGLIKLDYVHEFQTASIYESNLESDYISQICNNLKSKLPKAIKVPVLPEVVSINDVVENNENLSSIPIGIGVENLDIVKINLEKEKIIPIYTQDINDITNFLRILISQTIKLNNNKVLTFDFSQYMQGMINNNYIANNFEAYLNQIKGTNEKIVLFLLGFSKLKENLKTNPKLFDEILAKVKDENNIKIIMVDEVSKVNNCIYETWFKNNISRQNGIYIGSGISRQTIIQMTSFNRSLEKEIAPDFGYLITNGKPKMVKFVITED